MPATQDREQDPSCSDVNHLPDDTLQHIFRQLSTEERRTISSTCRKWQRLVAQSWVLIDIRLGGANYLDSAGKQIKWLLGLQLHHLKRLNLHLKELELSGIGVDYLLGPLLDLLEQGAFPELATLLLEADISLPGPLVHKQLKHLHLDMYALTATVQCPQLQTLHVGTVSMPGPTIFSEEALSVFQQLNSLHLVFQISYLDEPNASWFIMEGLGMLTCLEHVVLNFPQGVDVHLTQAPAFPPRLTHLELRCRKLEVQVAASRAIYMLNSCCVVYDVLQMNAELDALQQLALRKCRNAHRHLLKHGPGPFTLCE